MLFTFPHVFTFNTKFHNVPNENNQYTGEGYAARCDKQKWGYT